MAREFDACELPEGPPVWICGDCHVGNIGPIGSAEGKIDIQIRDLDQTVIGNPAHDLVRLGLSLAMAARSSDLPGVTTARIIEQLTEGYQAALSVDDAEHAPKVPGIVKRILRVAASRSWKHLADERIEGVAPMIRSANGSGRLPQKSGRRSRRVRAGGCAAAGGVLAVA